MVDLDSNPTKLIEVVETGKQMLMTRGSLTTFSIANDIAKYFAIIPAAFVTTYPQLSALNVMQLASPASAILSAVIFNALIIIFLIPLALKGVPYRPIGAARAAAPQPADLRPGRRDRAVHRHQAHRPAAQRRRPGLNRSTSHENPDSSRRERCSSLLTRGHRHRLSAGRHRRGQGGLPRAGRGQPDREGRQAGRLVADRPELQRPEVLLGPSVGDRPDALQRRRLRAAPTRGR